MRPCPRSTRGTRQDRSLLDGAYAPSRRLKHGGWDRREGQPLIADEPGGVVRNLQGMGVSAISLQRFARVYLAQEVTPRVDVERCDLMVCRVGPLQLHDIDRMPIQGLPRQEALRLSRRGLGIPQGLAPVHARAEGRRLWRRRGCRPMD